MSDAQLWTVALGLVAVGAALAIGKRFAREKSAPMLVPWYRSDTLWFLPDIVSHTYEILFARTAARMRAVFDKYGTAFGYQTILGRFIYITGPTAMRWAFRGDRKYVEWSIPAAHWLDLIGHQSLAGVHGDKHKRLRKCLSSAFTTTALAGYHDSIQLATGEFLQALAARTDATKGMPAVDIFMPVKNFAMDIALRIMFGVDTRSDKRLATMMPDFIVLMGGVATVFPVDLPFTGFGKAMDARRRILANLDLLRRERMEQMAAGVEPPIKDVLHNLLSVRDDDDEPLGEQELLETLLNFLFAGHDTSAAVMCSTLYALDGVIPAESVQKLRQEINDAFPAGQTVDHTTVLQLPYLEAFVKEVMRMFGPIAAMPRTITSDTELPVTDAAGRDYDQPLQPGTVLNLDFKEMMQDEKYYARPTQFEAERFMAPRDEDKKSPYTYVPFGGGIRMCIGMPLVRQELKLFLVHLMRGAGYQVKVESSVKHVFPMEFTQPTMRLIACKA